MRDLDLSTAYAEMAKLAKRVEKLETQELAYLPSGYVTIDPTTHVLTMRDTLPSGIFAEIRGSSTLYNLGVGANALVANTTGGYNLAVGYGSMLNNTTGANNMALGPFTMAANTTGPNNIAIGGFALVANTSGQNNVAIGLNAMVANTIGQNNFGMGVDALRTNVSGGYNVAIGASALRNATANYNVAIGASAGYSVTTMEQSVMIGVNAGFAATGGLYNIFIGGSAGYSNSTGYGNMFLGYKAGWLTTTGPANCFIGYVAGQANTTGQYNTFIGYNAAPINTTGNYNCFIGPNTGSANVSGQQNVYIGLNAGFSGTGSFNTYIGSTAGYSNTGASNVFIGYAAGYNAAGSNLLYIANTNTATPLILGSFVGGLTVHGQAAGAVTLIAKTAASATASAFEVHDSAAAVHHLLKSDGSFVLNETGASVDSRIEGDTDANLFYVRAPSNRIGIGTSGPNYKFHVNGLSAALGFVADRADKTIASGVIVATGSFHRVDTEGAAASDDLDTINGFNTGQLLVLTLVNAGRTVTVRHGVGNIFLVGGTDFTLNGARDRLTLWCDNGEWFELSRSDIP